MNAVKKSLTQAGVLVAIAAVAGLSIYLGESKKGAEEKQKEVEAKAFDFDKTKVKTVELTAKGATTVLERESADAWRITAPLKTRADKYAADGIIDRLAELKSKETVSEDQSKAADFGVDAPQFVVKATLDDGKVLELKVGAENSFDQSLYYSKAGDARIFMTDSGLKAPLDKSLFDLREKSIVTHEDKDVSAVDVVHATASWTAERDGEAWKLVKPISDVGDKSTIEGVLSGVRGARAKAFPEEELTDAKKFGLDKPMASVTFTVGADKVKKTLQFGMIDEAGTKKYFAHLAEGGPVAEVDESTVNAVGKPIADLRDKTLAKFDREAVRKLEFSGADGKTVTVERTKEKQEAGGEVEKFAVAGETRAIKGWKLTSTLYTLSTMKAAGIASEDATDLAKYGLDKPTKTLRVLTDGDKELTRILVGSVTGTRYYVMAAGGKRVYEAEKTTIDDLPSTIDDIVEAPPAPVAAPAPAAAPMSTPESGG